jgi:hypothetical protein
MKRNPYNRANPQFSDRDLKHGGKRHGHEESGQEAGQEKGG